MTYPDPKSPKQNFICLLHCNIRAGKSLIHARKIFNEKAFCLSLGGFRNSILKMYSPKTSVNKILGSSIN